MMRFNREDLLPALAAAASVADRKHLLPMLGHVLLRAERDTVRATGTDMEIEISVDPAIPTAAACAPFDKPELPSSPVSLRHQLMALLSIKLVKWDLSGMPRAPTDDR